MTIRKIRILDNDELRKELDALYEKQSKIMIAKWSLELARHVIDLVNLCEKDYPEISEGFKANEMWQEGKARMDDVRKAGFAIHRIARQQSDEIRLVAFRVIGQAVASGHMKEHGMVAGDYAIKLINIMYPNDLNKVSAERKWQLNKLQELSKPVQ